MDCKIIFGFILGIVGSFFGAFFAHLFSERRRRKEEFNNAADEFRTAFIPEQRLLSYDSLADKVGTNANDIIKAAIDRHEIAMIRFKPFVCKSQLDGYEKAWKEYAGDSKHFEQYSTTKHIDLPEKKKLALNNINNLLGVAKRK